MKKKILAISLLMISSGAIAETVTVEKTTLLSSELSTKPFNFAPQGLGYDASTNELIYAQQGSSTYTTNTNGALSGKLNDNGSYNTSFSADDDYYYYSSYSYVDKGIDFFSINKETGVTANITEEKESYGGNPLDVRDGYLYWASPGIEGEHCFYSYSCYDSITKADINSVDGQSTTVKLLGSIGIGDIAIDSVNNQVWTIDYKSDALLRQYNLATGELISSYDFNFDGLTAGLTYADDALYYYDWNLSGSYLTEISLENRIMLDAQGNIVADVSAPLSVFFLSLAFFAIGRRKT